MDRYLKPLDKSTRSFLRSSLVLTSLPQIVSELVQNSLDAGASNVEVGINCEDWECSVQDDGHGISRNDLNVIAVGICEGSCISSKSNTTPIRTFGFRGQALASVADLACLEISSKTGVQKESWTIILRGAKTLYNGPSLRWKRQRPGTTVHVRDAFYNLPVRRRSHTNPSRTVELIRKGIEATALMSHRVSFLLDDIAKGRIGGPSRGRIATIPKEAEEICIETGDLKLEGFLSLHKSQYKSTQYIYVNSHLLDPCDLHRLIENTFASCTRFTENRKLKPSCSESQIHSRRLLCVLNISIPNAQLDNHLEPTKTSINYQNSNAVHSIIYSAVQSFLSRHGLYVRTQRDPPLSPAKRRKLESPPDALAEEQLRLRPQAELTYAPSPRKLERHYAESQLNIKTLPNTQRPMVESNVLLWTDDKTGHVYIIDPRTGNSHLQGIKIQNYQDDDGGKEFYGPSNQRRDLGEVNTAKQDVPEWIRSALADTEAYTPAETDIPRAHLSLGNVFQKFQSKPLRPSESYSRSRHTLITPTMLPASYTKQDLLTAEVLGQVDRKFVACVIWDHTISQDGKQKTVCLIDQHAADERIRVEHFLRGLCSGFLGYQGRRVEIRMMEPAKPCVLTRMESSLLSSPIIRERFRKWGFDLCESSMALDTGDDFVQVCFQGLPEIIADKLLVGDELQQLVQGYLAQLEFEDETNEFALLRSDEPGIDEEIWLRGFRRCPKGMVDLLNSKACRGAIMFNDELSHEECDLLVRDLSKTATPFQCAHGRPSLVSIAPIASSGTTNYGDRNIAWHRLMES